MRSLLLCCLLVVMASMSGVAHAAPPPTRAVVIVSGGAAVSPFTTPQQGCASGLAAGNTDTELRADLLAHGYQVYTSPAMAGRGPVTDQGGFGAFGDCPITLAEDMTVDATGSIDLAGEHLARFLNYLHDSRGIDRVDVVAHSMGGLFTRAAMRVQQRLGSPVRVMSLTTLGTPWQGSFLSDYANDTTPMSDCQGDAVCETSMTALKDEVLRRVSGSGREVSQAYLMGPNGWNNFQAGVLDGIPVVLIGADRFNVDGPSNPTVWPNDRLVALTSAHAVDISDAVLPHRRCVTFHDTHSIFVSDLAGLPWDTALTWDPAVLDTVRGALAGADTALSEPNRQGCP